MGCESQVVIKSFVALTTTFFCNRNVDEMQSVYFKLSNSRAIKEKAVIYVSNRMTGLLWVVNAQHRYSTRSSAMLQDKLQGFCWPFCPTFMHSLVATRNSQLTTPGPCNLTTSLDTLIRTQSFWQ